MSQATPLTAEQIGAYRELFGKMLADLSFTADHPLEPLPEPEDLHWLLAQPDGREQLLAGLEAREQRIRASGEREGDPYRYGYELDHWHHADLLLGLAGADQADRPLPRMAGLLGVEQRQLRLPRECLEAPFWTLILLGGNRSGKSEYCAKRVMRHLVEKPGAHIVCLSENLQSSRENVQKLLWKYLPGEFKRLNTVKDAKRIYHINYSMAGGFTTEQLILPNRAKVTFKTYTQPPDDIEGWVLGSETSRSVGAWADENCPLPWIQALMRRAGYYGSLVLWSYTPVKGITPAIKELVGDTAATVMRLPSELLAGRVNVAGCPAGTMPYVQLPVTPGVAVLYFHSILNPFGSAQGTLYEGVKRLCAGKSSDVVARLAYGYTKDTIGRAWPNFGAWNLVDASELPAEGTNYQFVDPAGARNWYVFWVRVAPGKPPVYYIYREWPDYARYGEWAIPSSNPDQPDGETGPAQKSIGYGYARYKALFRSLESIPWREPALEPDPLRRELLLSALADGPERPLSEPIQDRFIDPRAGRDERVAQRGGTCAIDELAKVDRDSATGAEIAGGMRFHAAPGFGIDHGIEAVNSLLAWDQDQPFDRVMNAPRLYVLRSCRQVIWTLQHYTATGGEHAGGKDPADLLRYMATSRLRYIRPGLVPTGCMGSY